MPRSYEIQFFHAGLLVPISETVCRFIGIELAECLNMWKHYAEPLIYMKTLAVQLYYYYLLLLFIIIFLVFPYFFISVPCARLNRPYCQLLSARKYIVSYRITVQMMKLKHETSLLGQVPQLSADFMHTTTCRSLKTIAVQQCRKDITRTTVIVSTYQTSNILTMPLRNECIM